MYAYTLFLPTSLDRYSFPVECSQPSSHKAGYWNEVSTVCLSAWLLVYTNLQYCFITEYRESLSLCLWARNSHLLAIGTSRGNLMLYNHRTRRSEVICLQWLFSKHTLTYVLRVHAEKSPSWGSTLKRSHVEPGVIRWVYYSYVNYCKLGKFCLCFIFSLSRSFWIVLYDSMF